MTQRTPIMFVAALVVAFFLNLLSGCGPMYQQPVDDSGLETPSDDTDTPTDTGDSDQLNGWVACQGHSVADFQVLESVCDAPTPESLLCLEGECYTSGDNVCLENEYFSDSCSSYIAGLDFSDEGEVHICWLDGEEVYNYVTFDTNPDGVCDTDDEPEETEPEETEPEEECYVEQVFATDDCPECGYGHTEADWQYFDQQCPYVLSFEHGWCISLSGEDLSEGGAYPTAPDVLCVPWNFEETSELVTNNDCMDALNNIANGGDRVSAPANLICEEDGETTQEEYVIARIGDL